VRPRDGQRALHRHGNQDPTGRHGGRCHPIKADFAPNDVPCAQRLPSEEPNKIQFNSIQFNSIQ
jgi:hypothetical protein